MILVTGGAGLLGSVLIEQLLQQGKSVMALYHKTPLPHLSHPQLQQVQCDILDVVGLEAILQQGIETVYHCAAIVSFNPSAAALLYKVNVEGTANVVNAALSCGVKKMVHVSSVAALGRIRNNQWVDETMNWTEDTSNSLYGKSKYLGELEVWRGISEGLDAVIVNPVVILGPGDWNSGSAQIFKSVYNQFPWYTDGVTGFVDVMDVAKAMIALMDSTITAQRFILSAENKTYQEVFNMIATAFKKPQPQKKVTPFIAQVVWRLEAIKSWFTKKQPLVTKETAETALAKVYFNNQKLVQYLPHFTYQPLEITIQETCKTLLQRQASS